MNFSVTQNDLPLDKSKYDWNENTKTFSTNENDLVLDFSNIDYCTFITGNSCTFTTGNSCIFITLWDCVFKTGYKCTFNTGSDCTFNTEWNCVVIRRDIFEIIKLEENKTLKLNKEGVLGFKYIENKKLIIIDGKEIEISIESYNNLKKQLI